MINMTAEIVAGDVADFLADVAGGWERAVKPRPVPGRQLGAARHEVRLVSSERANQNASPPGGTDPDAQRVRLAPLLRQTGDQDRHMSAKG
ncbi:MAG: hypothetical protein ACXVCX_19960, partial [Ktedonobacterales bacterium]